MCLVKGQGWKIIYASIRFGKTQWGLVRWSTKQEAREFLEEYSAGRSQGNHCRAVERRRRRSQHGRRVDDDPIKRACGRPGGDFENVRVDHGRADVAVSKQLLDGSYVGAGLEQVRGKRMATMSLNT